MKKSIALLFLTASTLTLMACFGFIVSVTTWDYCIQSPCYVNEYNPAFQFCGIAESRTGKTCLEGPDKYGIFSKVYSGGTCVQGHCQSAVYDHSDWATNNLPHLSNCGS